ncbi:hypothetical protein [Mycetohabitans sp. B46]
MICVFAKSLCCTTLERALQEQDALDAVRDELDPRNLKLSSA